MQTERFCVTTQLNDADWRQLMVAATIIDQGQTVAFPTETVYGLAADARDEQAVARIFAAKGRPADNPLIVHVADADWLSMFAEPLTDVEWQLIRAFWPGPLTLVLKLKTSLLPENVTAGLDTVAVRQPAHPVALAFLQACGRPLAAPSANLSGKPSPTRAEHVIADLQGKIGGVIDGGATQVGIESTVVQCVADKVHVLRPGAVTAEQLVAALGGSAARVVEWADVAEERVRGAGNGAGGGSAAFKPRSPGVKYAHYAPSGLLTVVHAPDEATAAAWIDARLREARAAGHRTGVLTFDERVARFDADLVLAAGSLRAPATTAAVIYDRLRQFDANRITYILAEACSSEGIGAAVLNRLLKAAGGRQVRLHP